MTRARLTLDDLPLFASDAEIARALVGPDRAAGWLRDRLPTLERLAGFPPFDAIHGGRPTPLVKKFYDQYLHLDGAVPGGGPSRGMEDREAWKKKSARQA